MKEERSADGIQLQLVILPPDGEPDDWAGLIEDKYRVVKTADLTDSAREWFDAHAIDTFVFVLRPDRDYHARVALAAYAESVRGYDPTLADDLRQALDLLEIPEPGVPD